MGKKSNGWETHLDDSIVLVTFEGRITVLENVIIKNNVKYEFEEFMKTL